ncbi:MAG: tripartite tricarboxylate transporter TctB family protein, partial [Desulfobacterales bacterium]|nr:tripartite tricarboxylate transporter TctB family protein [Desulfobacterales bacterium]
PVALSPSLFCHITAFLLLILSLSLVISGLRDKRQLKPVDMADLAYKASRGGAAVLFSVLYIISMASFGYFVSTVAFMALFLWFSGVRSWKGGALFLAAVLPFIYLLFVKALKVLLPSGLLI